MLQREISIFSLNCRGLRDGVKRKALFARLQHNLYDVICLQEVHVVQTDLEFWKKQWNGNMVASCGTNRARGCLMLSRNNNVEFSEIESDNEGRYIIVNCKFNSRELVLINVYAPNNDQPEFFSEIGTKLETRGNPQILWIGDFNLVLDPKLDRFENVMYNRYSHEQLFCIMNKWSLVDIWRSRNPTTRLFSWKKVIGSESGSRIDNCFGQ